MGEGLPRVTLSVMTGKVASIPLASPSLIAGRRAATLRHATRHDLPHYEPNMLLLYSTPPYERSRADPSRAELAAREYG